jgi:glycosyltransferase involved in cell wall biosynthesis
VVAAGEIGGAERVVADLAGRRARGASPSRHLVALFSPSEALVRFLRESGADVRDYGRVHEHPGGYLRRALGGGAVEWLAALIRRERADIVHLHTFASQVLGTRAARRAAVPVLRTEHSTRVYRNLACWPFSRWSLRRADAVVAVSDHVARAALARAPWAAPRLQVITNGVAPARVGRGAAACPPPAGGPFRFVVVGRLEPRKGLDLAFAALARVPGAYLDVVGDGELRASLERAAGRAGVTGRVRFHGFLADPTPVVARAHAALSSARDEGLPMALLEAMAVGRPVVAVPVGGIPEIVRPGHNGWLARERSVDALAAVMAEAAADRGRAAALGVAARAFVVHHHALQVMVARYERLYRRLAAQNRPSNASPTLIVVPSSSAPLR